MPDLRQLRAIGVIKSDTVPIPSPSLLNYTATNILTGTSASQHLSCSHTGSIAGDVMTITTLCVICTVTAGTTAPALGARYTLGSLTLIVVDTTVVGSTWYVRCTTTTSGALVTGTAGWVSGTGDSSLTVTAISSQLLFPSVIYDNATPTYLTKISNQLSGFAGGIGTYQLLTNVGTVASGTIKSRPLDLSSTVPIGAIVYDNTDGTCAMVTAVSVESITVGASLFGAAGKSFSVYGFKSGTGLPYTQDGFTVSVSGAGNISFILFSGDTISALPVTAGQVLPYNIKQVLSTGTTATGIIATQ